MNNKMIKLFALTATLLVATQPLAAMWGEETWIAQPAQKELKEKLFYCIEGNYLKTIGQMIAEYPDLVNAKNKDGKTPLHIAVEEGNLDVVRLLIKHGADSNAKDLWGNTPLHRGAEYGHLDVTKLLIEGGADLNIQNNSNQTPLDVVNTQTNPNQAIITYLRLAEESYQEYAANGSQYVQDQYGPWYIAAQSCLCRAYLGAAPLKVTAGNNTYFLDLNTIYKHYIQNGKTAELETVLQQCNFDKLSKEQQSALQKIGFPLNKGELKMQNKLTTSKETGSEQFSDVIIYTQNTQW